MGRKIMIFSLFIKGFLLGFSIAAPIGPIGILCIRTTIAQGFWAGFICGFGASTASALYGAIAGFGLTMVCDFLITHRLFIGLLGGLFLLYLGAMTLLSKPMEPSTRSQHVSWTNIYGVTFLMTLINPMTILSYIAVFAGLGIEQNSCVSAWPMVLGIFLGSLCWWCILSGTISVFRTKLNTASMNIVNKISGLIILGFGVYILWSLAR